MGDKLCVLTYVFGENYQSFIPTYVYSVWKAYPEYDTMIYTKGSLPEKVESQLAMLRENGCNNFSILPAVEDVGLSKSALKNIHVKMALRWLVLPRFLRQYKAAYIGDIDLFICREEPGIFEQHEAHCQFMNTPYSNFARFHYPKSNLRLFFKRLKDYGIRSTINRLNQLPTQLPRLSGLHYFQISECIDKVESAIPDIVDEINAIFAGRHNRFNIACVDNEWLLYRLYEKAGFPLIEPKKIDAMDLMDRNNPKSDVFRPHHGLHLGIWRNYINGKLTNEGKLRLAQSSIYLKYYKYVKLTLEEDILFQKLLADKKLFAAQIFDRMFDFYENYLTT